MATVPKENAKNIGGGPGNIATMNEEELLKIKQFVRSANNYNGSMKIFLDIREGVLLSIKIRFMAVSTVAPSDTARKVFDAIEILSHRRVFPISDEKLLKNGILEMGVSYMNRRCGAKNITDPLEFIRDSLIDILTGKKTI